MRLSKVDSTTERKKQVSARRLENRIVVGDRVLVSINPDSQPIIMERLTRQNQLSRSTSTRSGGQLFEQVLVSNVDQVLAVLAVSNPELKWNLLDRYLVLAEAVDLPIWIVITKMDLVETGMHHAKLFPSLDAYQKMGYPILFTSSTHMEGISELLDVLRHKNSVLIGKSGVGKSSLLNALIPGLDLRVIGVNAITGKGRHTTTAMRLFPIDENTNIIDSPGSREFGFWNIDPEDLDWYFRDIRPYLGQCKFKLDCRHEEEPGCAVRQAVVNGHIDPRRYQSYLRLKEDILS
jgi:ribosome biogenesis GTPase